MSGFLGEKRRTVVIVCFLPTLGSEGKRRAVWELDTALRFSGVAWGSHEPFVGGSHLTEKLPQKAAGPCGAGIFQVVTESCPGVTLAVPI